ncbi:hypothetical protein DESC_960002 [Desulfosarcina cetonica]|nr:hypothetical protein DESC_960002 [Desulfosarcina cetonica]
MTKVDTDLLDKGKPRESVGRKATDLTLLMVGRQGSRAAEGKRLLPSWIRRLPKMNHGGLQHEKSFSPPINPLYPFYTGAFRRHFFCRYGFRR